MDFFEELGKQTSKMLNNFATTMNEITSMATTSADSAANIVLLKGKLESLKIQLDREYRELGRAVIEEPNVTHFKSIRRAKSTLDEIKNIEATIATLKEEIKNKSQESKQLATDSAEEFVKDSKENFDDNVAKVKDFIDDRTKQARLQYDKTIEELEKEDGVDKQDNG